MRGMPDWLRTRGSILPSTLLPVSVFTLWATLIAHLTINIGWPLQIADNLTAVLGLVLGLLLVFRNNASYDRYWEGRRLWANMVVCVRNFERLLWITVPESSTRDVIGKVRALKLILAFATATKHHLRGEYGCEYEDMVDLMPEVVRQNYVQWSRTRGAFGPTLRRFKKHRNPGFFSRLRGAAAPTRDHHPEQEPLLLSQHETRRQTIRDLMPPMGGFESLQSQEDRYMYDASQRAPASRGSVSAPVGKTGAVDAAGFRPSVANIYETSGRQRSDSASNSTATVVHATGAVGSETNESRTPTVSHRTKHTATPSASGVSESPIGTLLDNNMEDDEYVGDAQHLLPGDTDPVLADPLVTQIASQRSVPMEISFLLSSYLVDQRAQNNLDVSQYSAMITMLNTLVDIFTNLERILTPAPLAYRIHLKQCLIIYFLLLPCQMIRNLGWVAILVQAVATFVFWGIDAIAREIENPMGYDANDLPLNGYIMLLRSELRDFIAKKPVHPMDWNAYGDTDSNRRWSDASAAQSAQATEKREASHQKTNVNLKGEKLFVPNL